MDPNIFLNNFEMLAEAPNGVQKLRELILQLAVMGKLVPQDPTEGTAASLLEKIENEKKRLEKEGRIKNSRLLPAIDEAKIPFEIPHSWEWVQLGDVVNYNGGQKVSPDEIPEDAWLLDLEDIEKNTSRILRRVSFKEKKSKSTKARFDEGDVLYGKLRPYLNKIVVADECGYCTTEIVPLSIYTGIYPYYLMYALKRPDFLEYVNSKTYGIKMPRLGTEDARKALFPLPPLDEQKRIVAKVDELMTLCDQLEARQQKKVELRSKLNNASLDKMLSAESQDEFEENWRRICENFDLLYDNPENVEELRKAVLQLAVQGKLVEQDEGDEPASVLIEKIRVEKEKLINEKKIKKEKELEPVDSDDLPFESPTGWAWEKIYNICFVTKLAGFEYTKYIQLNDFGDVPIIRAQNVKMNRIVEKNLKFIDLQTSQMLKRSALTKPSILMTFIGAGIGDVALFDDCKRWHLGPNVAKLEPFNNLGEKIDIKYLLLYLMSETGRNEIFKYKKSTAQPSLSMGTIRDIKVILPPLNEQKRIFEKVEQLMGLCDELEAKLRKGREESERLMEAVVRGLIEGAAAEI